MKKLMCLVFLLPPLVGCGARVPVEVKIAMEKQAQELQQIQSMHRESVDILFKQIRVLQLFILDEKEKEFQQRYARGPKAVTIQGDGQALVYRDPATQQRIPASGNPDVDLIAVSTNRIISDWFSNKRAETEEQLLQSKQEFMKLQDHVEIARQINAAVIEYLDSLINLRKQQKELGNNLVKKLSLIPGAAALQSTFINLLIPKTEELEKELTGAEK